MSEERLRLIAEFRDQASAGVRRLGRELGEVRETPGMSAAARWMRGFQVDSERIQRNAAGVGSVMGAMGIGGVAAAGGIAAVVGALKSFSDRTIDLQAVSRETGIAMTRLRELQNAAKELHVDPDNITKGVQYLTGQLALARRGYGELFGLLNQVEPEFMRKIMAEDPAKAMDDVLARLARIPDDYVKAGHSLADGIAAQKQWSAALLGDQGLGRLVEQGPQALATAMQNAAKNTAPVTKDMVEAAKAMDASINNLNEKLESMATKAAPEFFKQVGNIVGEFDQLVTTLDKLQKWWGGAKAGDVASAVGDTVQDQLTLKPRQKYDELHGEGLFTKPENAEAAQARLQAMQAEVDTIKSKLAADKNPVSFPVRHADDFSRLNELAAALRALRQNSPDLPPPPQTDRAGLLHRSSYGGPGSGSLFHNAAYSDDEGSSRGGIGGSLVWEFREAVASGAKAGVLGALREFQTQGSDGIGTGGGEGGVIQASYGGTSPGAGRYGGGPGGRRAPALQASRGPDSYTGTGGTAENAGPGFTSGMRARNLGNIGYFGQHEAGLVGPSSSRDVDHSIAMYATQEDGIRAAARLALRKYQGGMRDTASLIAGPKGWTPGALGPGASVNIARAMGLTNRDDLHLDQPAQMHKFLRGLAMQEHGKAGAFYSDKMIDDALAGRGSTTAAGGVPAKMPEWLDDKSRRELAGVNKALANDLLAASEQTGLHFRVLQGLRTQAEAEHNAITGRGVRNSQHLFGAAADIAVQDAQGHDINDRAAYRRFADAYTAHSRAGGGSGRWLGDLPGRWGSDIAHFDQGIGYGQAHKRDAYGVGGPTKDDVASGNAEIYRSPQNPFMRHPADPPRKSLLDEAAKAGLGSTTVKHEGGAVIEIRGLPQGKGTRTSTSGMIEAVNLRRGGPLTQVG